MKGPVLQLTENWFLGSIIVSGQDPVRYPSLHLLFQQQADCEKVKRDPEEQEGS